MLRDFFRIIGSACIIAGVSLFIIQSDNDQSEKTSEPDKLKVELQLLQSKLVKTEEELANLQTATIAASTPVNGNNKETPSEQNVKLVLLIEPGMNSTTVAQLLERAGIIEDRTALESYLDKNKLTGKVQIGKYDIDSSMDIQTIAAIITK